MHPNKAPSPDGMNPEFYQRFWEMCGKEVLEACRSWIDLGTLLAALNETNVVLIPKCDSPCSMKDFQPIFPCNVAYKILSKVRANRLKLVLRYCISKEQSTFVQGRSILDNVMMA